MRWFLYALFALSALSCGCSDSAPVPRHPNLPHITTRMTHTAGGGSIASTSYRGRISIGAPQPYGQAQGSGKFVNLGAKPSP